MLAKRSLVPLECVNDVSSPACLGLDMSLTKLSPRAMIKKQNAVAQEQGAGAASGEGQAAQGR